MRKPVAILLAVLIAAACREPSSRERFIPGDGPWVFPVSMSDTTVRYGFDFYTRVDAWEFPAEIRLDVSWRSPSDSVFSETVYLPLSEKVYLPYRSGVSPVEAGDWTLSITASPVPEGFRGLGLVVRKEWDTEN